MRRLAVCAVQAFARGASALRRTASRSPWRFRIEPLLHLKRLAADRRGSVVLMFAATFSVLLGVVGLGTEVSVWYMVERSMQNAADAAVLAASANSGANYLVEAREVTKRYGFANGTNNVVVTASNSASCPAGGSTCYSVTITGSVPLLLSPVVGFTSAVTVSGVKQAVVGATAVADPSQTRPYCVLALAGSGAQGIVSNGAPFVDLTGCNIMSNTGATCNGHTTLADVGDAAGTNNGCGVIQHSNVPVVKDPYAYLAANIPSNGCAGVYPQIPAKNGTPLPESNQLTGSKTWNGNQIFCGDVQLTGNVTATGSPGVLVIENGLLDLNGFSFTGSNLTVVFTGTNAGGYSHYPTSLTNGGTLDIAAPTSGAWAGVAIYQDPALTAGVSFTYAGNSPAWDVMGLVYLPHAGVTFSGIVNKSGNSALNCFDLVIDHITINGTGEMLPKGPDCAQAGLTRPTTVTRGALVN